MHIKILSVLAAALAILALSANADDKAKANDKPAAEARRKANHEFQDGQRDKRWEFEDELDRDEAAFKADMRVAHRDAERKLSAAMFAAGNDAKAQGEAHKAFAEAQNALKAKRDEFQKKVEARRADFRKQADEARKAFEAARQEKK
ncbi:MAG: hypothetical protein HY075_13265 [Deltaproteobacteria bacterium]|nr:hypothetical protein [Deltaproteobacteria bacterium]